MSRNHCDGCHAIFPMLHLKQFRCQHAFCEKCISFLVVSHFFTEGLSSQFLEGDLLVNCLKCKNKTITLEKSTVSEFQKNIDICDICEDQPAFLLCCKCELNSCKNCFQTKHNITKKSLEHEIFYFDEKNRETIVYCDDCTQISIAKHVCHNCLKNICSQCCNSHTAHQISEVDQLFLDQVQEKKAHAYQNYSSIQSFIKEKVEESAKKLMKQEEEMIKDINKSADDTIALLNDYRKSMIENIKNNKILSKIDNYFKNLDEFFCKNLAKSFLPYSFSFALDSYITDQNSLELKAFEIDRQNANLFSKFNSSLIKEFKEGAAKNILKAGFLGPIHRIIEISEHFAEDIEPSFTLNGDTFYGKLTNDNKVVKFKINHGEGDAKKESIFFAYPVYNTQIHIYNFSFKSRCSVISVHKNNILGIKKFEDFLYSYSLDEIIIHDLKTLQMIAYFPILKNNLINTNHSFENSSDVKGLFEGNIIHNKNSGLFNILPNPASRGILENSSDVKGLFGGDIIHDKNSGLFNTLPNPADQGILAASNSMNNNVNLFSNATNVFANNSASFGGSNPNPAPPLFSVTPSVNTANNNNNGNLSLNASNYNSLNSVKLLLSPNLNPTLSLPSIKNLNIMNSEKLFSNANDASNSDLFNSLNQAATIFPVPPLSNNNNNDGSDMNSAAGIFCRSSPWINNVNNNEVLNRPNLFTVQSQNLYVTFFRDFYNEMSEDHQILFAFSTDLSNDPINFYKFQNNSCSFAKSFQKYAQNNILKSLMNFRSNNYKKTFLVLTYISEIQFIDIKSSELICKFSHLANPSPAIKFTVEDNEEFIYFGSNQFNQPLTLSKGKIQRKEINDKAGDIEMQKVYNNCFGLHHIKIWDKKYAFISCTNMTLLIDRKSLDVVKEKKEVEKGLLSSCFSSKILKVYEEGKQYIMTTMQGTNLMRFYKCF